MRPRVLARLFGLLLLLFSATMLPPLVLALYDGDGQAGGFLEAGALLAGLGLALWWPARDCREDLRLRDGFLVVVLFWVGFGILGALPLWLSPALQVSFTDAVFESVSGLTTTGATVLVGLDALPRSLLFYRQFLQWLGGMGIIVLAVAVLPMLGVGGMQLYRAEFPGPVKDSKLTPRIAETAKALWLIYLALTVACAAAYRLAGMAPFDALAHAFSTVSTGGLSTHDASLGHFASHRVELVAVVFMLLAGMNFGLHFAAWRRLSLAPYLQDAEWRTYIAVLAVTAVIAVFFLWWSGTAEDPGQAFWDGVFQTVSIATSTGFTTANYAAWPGFLPVLLLFVSFVGGCSGSTGGGIKVMRFLLLIKQGVRELRRLVHPHAELPVKIGRRPLDAGLRDAVWGFFAAYVALFAVLLLALMATGVDQVTAFSAVAACLNNLGPGLGEVAANYAGLGDGAKWLLSLAMVCGRLEVFTLLVLLTPDFWRR